MVYHISEMDYSVKKLADIAGVSVRTLHYYDEVGLLKPEYRNDSGYRVYGEEAVVRLQQIMFFRELDFSLDDIKKIMARPDFDILEALQLHRELLKKKSERIDNLLDTIDKTINKLRGQFKMEIKEFYQGFSDEKIEKYREEVRRRWGEKALKESEDRVIKMGKDRFASLQAEGGKIFQTISDNISTGYTSDIIQGKVAEWRQWLENFHHYSDEAVLGLGQAYSQNTEFAAFFQKYQKDLPEFLTKAIEYYCLSKK